MAKDCSFDVISEVDLQEVDNAVNQASKEIQLRYDFKGSKSSYEFDRTKKIIVLIAQDTMKLHAMQEILRAKMVKRSVPLKALRFEKEEKTFGEMVRQEVVIQVGISKENAKLIVKDIKTLKAKVQASIQGDIVRVSGKKIDDLQEIIAFLKGRNYDFALQFVNYRN
ncbi:MAG: YajQ family cyclic di-GMP-binding protein [Candidatus Omnitrophica bacterium]|nr:YajQ family cyclic di-GMP-binding protein [Candidatus Omnitrophota bacterium]